MNTFPRLRLTFALPFAITLAEVLWVVAVVAYVLAFGCASAPPDALRTAIDVNNAAVAGLTAARRAQEARLVIAFRQREKLCLPPPDPGWSACRRDAEVATLGEFAPEQARLSVLVLLEAEAADALAAAQACRNDKLDCEAAKLRAAEAALSQVRGALAGGGL